MVKLDIITGFLGAGKTTLINKLLAEAYIDDKPVLVENEFGEVAIDDSLVSDPEVQVQVLANGCICCTLQGDFISGLGRIIEQYSPARVVIEPTGLADPEDIVALLDEASQTINLEISSLITVVDGENLLPLLAVTGDLFKKQISGAGLIVLNRSERLDEEGRLEVIEAIHELSPHCRVLDEGREHLDGLAILTIAESMPVRGHMVLGHMGRGEAGGSGAEGEAGGSGDGGEEVAGHGHGEAGHGHHHDDDAEAEAESFYPSGTFDDAEVEAFFEALGSGSLGLVYRAKGFLKQPDGGYTHLEYVYGGGRQSASSYLGPAKLVVIGKRLDRPGIIRMFEKE